LGSRGVASSGWLSSGGARRRDWYPVK
jgi:hypothetical protein